jgi:hypothetical protein
MSHQIAVLRSFKVHVRADGSAVSFVLGSTLACKGTVTAKTLGKFAAIASKTHRRQVSLGTVRFSLAAGKPKIVVLKLSKASRRLLLRKHSLKVQITVTLSSLPNPLSVSHRTVTLTLPAKHPHRG